ncbi:hypothetical protein V1515DRAFT_642389 [Lipomyces mesembrius]
MGMPCAHTIQPMLGNGDSLEPEQFKSQWYIEHGDLEPMDCRLWVQNPETIRPLGPPGIRQRLPTARLAEYRLERGREGVEAEVAGDAGQTVENLIGERREQLRYRSGVAEADTELKQALDASKWKSKVYWLKRRTLPKLKLLQGYAASDDAWTEEIG